MGRTELRLLFQGSTQLMARQVIWLLSQKGL